MAKDDEDKDFKRIPTSDFEKMNKDIEALGSLRSAFPEKYRGKEADFFKDQESLGKRLKDIEDKDKSELERSEAKVKELETQLASSGTGDSDKDTKITELEGERDSLKKDNNTIRMWGHVGRQSQLRNVVIPEEFITESLLENFDLSQYDLSDEKGQKKFGDDVWKTILEPAHKKAESAFQRMGGRRTDGKPAVAAQDRKTEDGPTALTRMGQQA